MPELEQVLCDAHGRQPTGLACTHIAHGLLDGTTPGFVIAPEEPAEAYPPAWCADCERTIGEVGWKHWLHELADFKMLCAVCYLEARDVARDAGAFRDLRQE